MKMQHLSAYFSAALALMMTIAIISSPEEAFQASIYGLNLWLEIVLPALLPFFVMADILMGLGVVHFLGVLLEPVMKRVFRIPGAGGFAVAMGLVSGYPIGARITGQLCRAGLCSSVEGERLVSLANTADPLFMIGAVAIGMFAAPEIGMVIVLAHYSSALFVGIGMRFHGKWEPKPQASNCSTPIFQRALEALVEAKKADSRPFGQLVYDAVSDAFRSLLFIGGCIMVFSVLLKVLSVSGVTQLVVGALAAVLSVLSLSEGTINALVSGVLEITIGTNAASGAPAPLHEQVIAASAIIGWSGLSVHSQVAAMLHGTKVRMWPYLVARGLHAVLAALFAFILLGPAATVIPDFLHTITATEAPQAGSLFLYALQYSFGLAVIITGLSLTPVLLVHGYRRLVILHIKRKGP